MAKIIHAADIDEELASDPIAAGFKAIATGRYPLDKENLEHQFEVFDALYAWCRLDSSRNQA